MSLRNAAPPPTRIARSSTAMAVSPATRLGLQHPQRAHRRVRWRARRRRRRRAWRPRRPGSSCGPRAARTTGWSASVWSRCSSRAVVTWAMALAMRGVHQPEAGTRRSGPGTPAARRRARCRGRRRRRRGGPPTGMRAPWRGTGLDALPRRPSPSNGRGDLDARGVARDQPQRGALGGRSRAARPHVRVGLARRGHPALARVEHDLVAVGGGRRRAGPRTGCASRSRRRPASRGAEPAAIAAPHVVGPVLPRSTAVAQ